MRSPLVSSPLARRGRVDRRICSIDERLGKLEASKEKPRGVLARIASSAAPAWPQLLTSVVMLILGFAVKDSVDLAIRQQQLQQSFATGARAGLEQMSRDGADAETTKQAAAVMAAFGSAAVMPLVNELRSGGNRTVGAEAGLGTLTLAEPEAVCRALRRALAHSGQWLNAEAYMATVRTLALADCVDALDLLRDHLASLTAAQATKTEPAKQLMQPRPTPQQIKSSLEELKKAVDLLGSLPLPPWSKWFGRSPS